MAFGSGSQLLSAVCEAADGEVQNSRPRLSPSSGSVLRLPAGSKPQLSSRCLWQVLVEYLVEENFQKPLGGPVAPKCRLGTPPPFLLCSSDIWLGPQYAVSYLPG